MTQPISCELHDHLEVACLYRYQMRIALVSGHALRGRAVTTETQPDKTEVLIVSTEEGTERVALHDISSIAIETKGARFQSLEFPHR